MSGSRLPRCLPRRDADTAPGFWTVAFAFVNVMAFATLPSHL